MKKSLAKGGLADSFVERELGERWMPTMLRIAEKS